MQWLHIVDESLHFSRLLCYSFHVTVIAQMEYIVATILAIHLQKYKPCIVRMCNLQYAGAVTTAPLPLQGSSMNIIFQLNHRVKKLTTGAGIKCT